MIDDEIMQLLPAYANGTLSGEEKTRVEAALQASDTLRKELDFLNAVRMAAKDQAVESPTEWGWQRLQRDIRKSAPARRTADNVWKIAAIAAALVVVVQFGFITEQLGTVEYQTLSGSISGENLVQVRFSPDARQQDIQQLLVGVKADIVSGPSASGLYHIAVEDVPAALVVLESSDLVVYANRD